MKLLITETSAHRIRISDEGIIAYFDPLKKPPYIQWDEVESCKEIKIELKPESQEEL